MHINSNDQVNYISTIQNRNSNISNDLGTPIPNKSHNDTVTISNAGLDAAANWQKIANNYDVTNISQNQMANMVSELTDSQLISSTDGLYLMAPRSMNFDPETKFDLLASTEKSLNFSKENGGSVDTLKNLESAVDILKTLQELFGKS
jgi:hypothetical protein